MSEALKHMFVQAFAPDPRLQTRALLSVIIIILFELCLCQTLL